MGRGRLMSVARIYMDLTEFRNYSRCISICVVHQSYRAAMLIRSREHLSIPPARRRLMEPIHIEQKIDRKTVS